MRAHLSDARFRDDRLVLHLLGHLVKSTDTRVVEDGLMRGYRRKKQTVVLDCSKLKSIDQIGLEFLHRIQAHFATAEGAQLILQNVPDVVVESKAS